MLDSGASANFISSQLLAELGFSVQNQKVQSVRLANGRIVQTVGTVQLTVIFGAYHYLGSFQVLDCDVPLILGMSFLSKVVPQINFGAKTVFVTHKGAKYQLPTCVISKNDPKKCQAPTCGCVDVQDHNSFNGLPIEQSVENSVEESVDRVAEPINTRNYRVRFLPNNVCKQCSCKFVGQSKDKYCENCHDRVFKQFEDDSVGSRVAGSGMNNFLNCEMVTFQQFVRAGKKKQYVHIGVMQFEGNIECDHSLNFTHRATLGGGDDADAKGQHAELAEAELARLKSRYGQVFSEPQYPVDRSTCPEEFFHEIPLVDEGAAPPKRKLYPLDSKELAELKDQIKTFLDSGRIEISNGAYGAPILFAKKKDGGLRMCIDYRALNGQIKSDVYPLPLIDELLQRLNGATVFSKLDMRDGYHQIPMLPKDKTKTAFTCRYGTFQFTVMPFGLTNAPSSFQRIMNKIFFDLLDHGVLCYLDDLLIYSKNIADHQLLLDKVFSLLQKYKLYIKESKCKLFLTQVNFLGHVINSQGVSLESGKVEVVRNWPQPQTVVHVQQFLGLCNYYRRFILRFSELASPLTLLTRKGQLFQWGQQQQQAFDRLKDVLCNAPILRVFDPLLSTRVVCDASNFCVGAVLEQQFNGQWHPVEFYSKRLSKSERNYSATDREYVAIRQALERWRHFLIGIKFQLLTDHIALTYLHTSAGVSRRNARWLEFLSQFSFDIHHIKGKENVVADALSRVPGTETLSLLQLCSGSSTMGVQHVDDTLQVQGADCNLHSVITIFENSSFISALLKEQQGSTNSWFLGLVKQAKQGSRVYVYRNGLLCKLVGDHFCPVLPEAASSTVQVVLSDLHSSALGGHLGFRKLYDLASRRFFWQNMTDSIKQFIKQCSICQANKHSTQKPQGQLQAVENPASPFAHVTMDFVTHLPESSRGNDAIFSIVDRFSRYCRFIPCRSDISALDVAQLFFENWVCRFGMPTKIISDRDVKFQSQFWQQLCNLLQCRVAMSTAYHPQTDGLTERYHRTIEQVLRCYCSGQQRSWCSLIAQCEFAINSTLQDAVQASPFQVVYGFQPTLPLDVQLQDLQVPAVASFVDTRQLIQQSVQRSLLDSQIRMAKFADLKRRPADDLKVGQDVWLATKHLPLRGNTRKLSAIWAGPFKITDKVGDAAFRLALPMDWGIHDVFHVSQLKLVVGQVLQEQPIEVDDGIEFEVESILAQRVVRGRRQFLIKWRGFDEWQNSWEPEENLGNAQDKLKQFLLTSSRKLKSRRGSSVRNGH